MKKILIPVLAFICFSFAFSTAALAQIKVGIVDMMSAIELTEKDGALKKLKAETEKRQNKLKGSEKKLLAFKQEIEESASMLSEDKLREKAAQYQQMMIELQRDVQTYEQEMMEMRNKLLGDVQTKMSKITTDIAKEKSLDIVLERNEGGVVYFQDSFDLTTELVKRYKAAK